MQPRKCASVRTLSLEIFLVVLLVNFGSCQFSPAPKDMDGHRESARRMFQEYADWHNKVIGREVCVALTPRFFLAMGESGSILHQRHLQ